MNASFLRLLPFASVVALTACSAEPMTETTRSQSPRPVLSVIATASASRDFELRRDDCCAA